MNLKEKLAKEYVIDYVFGSHITIPHDHDLDRIYLAGFDKAMQLVRDYIHENTIEGTFELEWLGNEDVE